jgi:DNA-binding response OmpR family regulator
LSHTLLLVDDDIPFSTLVRTTLEKEGYRVLLANHANEARKILDQSYANIEVMLLDWSMPDITGIEFLRTIKQEKNFEDIQVIMQTIMGGADDIQQGIDAGAFFYLVKPVKKELLCSTIRAAIRDSERKKDLLQKLKDSEQSFRFLTEGEFHFRSVHEGDFLAIRIANECPNPQEAILVSELFANAVEHGNLGLSYEEKTQLISENRLNEEVERRLQLPEHRHKFVSVNFQRLPEKIRITVQDMGRGFEFEQFLRLDDARVFHNHGRGIAILNALFPLRYLGKGNEVIVEIPLLKTAMYN